MATPEKPAPAAAEEKEIPLDELRRKLDQMSEALAALTEKVEAEKDPVTRAHLEDLEKRVGGRMEETRSGIAKLLAAKRREGGDTVTTERARAVIPWYDFWGRWLQVNGL